MPEPADVTKQSSIAELPIGRLDGGLLGIAYWYLTGLVMFLGFSFGFEFVVRNSTAAPRDVGYIGAFRSAGGHWYSEIVEEGYGRDPRSHLRSAFFPVYPLIGRAVRATTRLPTEAALLIVSNGCLLAAFILLARYVRLRFPGAAPGLVDWTLIALGLSPTCCFFRMCNTESTFLLLAISVMYGIHRRWPLPAVVFLIGAATATRATGVALLAPLAIDIWRSHQAMSARAWRLALWLPLACWGLAAFVVFQYAVLGDAFATVHAQSVWRLRPEVDWSEKLAALATLEPIRSVYDRNSPAYWAAWDRHGAPWFSLCFANPLFFVAVVALTTLGAAKRWLTSGESMLVLLLLLIPYVTRAHEMGMHGMGRFVAVAFPIYIVVGQLLSRLPKGLSAVLSAISAFFLAAYSALFAAGFLIV